MNISSINGFSLYEIIIYFTIYAFLGWSTEVLYAYHVRGTFVNRGFLHGPFCPIYGSGIVMIIVLLDNYKNNILLLFILAAILTSILEYITGYILERFFNSKWWDYSEDAFNLHGRICLLFSILWGIACVFVIKVVQPIIHMITIKIPEKLLPIISFVIVVYFITDLIFTIISLIEFNSIIAQVTALKDQCMSQISSLHDSALELSTSKSSDLEEYIAEVKEKCNSLVAKFKKNHVRLLNSFPHGSFNKTVNLLNDLKNYLNNRHNQ